MSAITLTGVWFNRLDDPSQSLHSDFVTQINLSPQHPGEFRRYGNSRFRAVDSGPMQQQVPLAFTACSPAFVATILAWSGVDLCYRDDSGRRFFGRYYAPQVSRHSYNDEADITLTFGEVSVDEAV